MLETTLNRRAFLGVSAAVGTSAALVPLLAPGAVRAKNANETLRVGVVGPGGRGTGLLNECIEHGNRYNARVTAVCDLWNRRRDKAAARVKDAYGSEPKVYRRIEEVLADDDVDAVIIATPDHQHAKMLKMAVEAGKDVYCEKPMGNVLEEANAALEAVKSSDRVVQIGTQRRADPKYRQAARLMQQGILGDVVKADVIWNAHSPYRWAKSAEELASLKESDVDWKAFLMGKSYRPFDARIYRSFRLFRDFSSGIIDQWMTHGIDVVHMLSGEPFPRSVVAHGGIYKYHDYRENPDTIQVALEYGEGDKRFLATYATSLINGAGRATRLQGTRGTLEVENTWRVSGDGAGKAEKLPEAQEISEMPGTLPLMANWLDCVRRRDREGLYCPVDAGYGHSVACIMSAQALWSGQRVLFDPQKRTLQAG